MAYDSSFAYSRILKVLLVYFLRVKSLRNLACYEMHIIEIVCYYTFRDACTALIASSQSHHVMPHDSRLPSFYVYVHRYYDVQPLPLAHLWETCENTILICPYTDVMSTQQNLS
jgi:hypothetical protein